MLAGPGLPFTIVAFFLVLGPLIFVHELGHYLVGRWCGVKAEVFSIGFGRQIAGWTDKRGTRWKLGWLPFGGYVKFAGDMNAASQPSREWLMLPAEERAKTFQSKPVWQRFLIVFAGPATNLLFAILLFIGIFAAIGYPTTPSLVTGVEQGSPADRAGIKPGDRITSINGESMRLFTEVSQYVMIRPGERVDIGIERDGARRHVVTRIGAKVMRDQFGNEGRVGRLGVVSTAVSIEKLPAWQLPLKAVDHVIGTLKTIWVTTGQLIVGDRSVKELGGPLKMAQISGQQASLGWLPLFWLMAVISINLAFINLLPIPMLDGGHLLFYAVEAVRRKPLEPQAQEWAFRAGLAALLMLMIFVTLNDLASFGLLSRLAG